MNLLKKYTEIMGGDAILEYESFQSAVAYGYNENSGKTENAYFLSAKATILRYTDN